jgi:hypothetical protein
VAATSSSSSVTPWKPRMACSAGTSPSPHPSSAPASATPTRASSIGICEREHRLAELLFQRFVRHVHLDETVRPVASIPAREIAGPFCELLRFVAVLELETGDALKKRRCSQQHRRGGTLLRCLTPIGRRLEATRILLQPRRNCSRVECIGTNAVICPTLSDADGQEGVSSLGLAVGANWRVRNEVEIQIIENYRRE